MADLVKNIDAALGAEKKSGPRGKKAKKDPPVCRCRRWDGDQRHLLGHRVTRSWPNDQSDAGIIIKILQTKPSEYLDRGGNFCSYDKVLTVLVRFDSDSDTSERHVDDLTIF